jgi:hypothetical protein
MKINKYLLLFFALYLTARLYLSFQAQYFTNDYSYFALTQIQNIADTGRLLLRSELSFGGRTFVFQPLYFYFLGMIFAVFRSIAVLKIINNILASLILVAVYILAQKLLRNRTISLLCSVVSGFIPAYITETMDNISVYSILIPGTFFLIYLFLEIESRKDAINLIVPLTIVLVLSSPASFLILLGFLIYILVSYLENIPVERIKLEYLSFFVFLYLWANFIIYKTAFQMHGFAIIWGNVPDELIKENSSSILFALTNIGFLPFIFGLFTSYRYLLVKKNKHITLFISFFLSTFVVYMMRIVAANIGLIFLGIALVILFGQFLKDLFLGLRDTKIAHYSWLISAAIIILLLISQIIPGIYFMISNIKNSPSQEYIQSLSWLKNNTTPGSIIVALPQEGNLITYFAQRKNIIDSEYLLIDNANSRLKDVYSIYTDKFRVDAIRRIERYNASYILFSQNAITKFNMTQLSYADEPCFEIVYNETSLIYKVNQELCYLQNS